MYPSCKVSWRDRWPPFTHRQPFNMRAYQTTLLGVRPLEGSRNPKEYDLVTFSWNGYKKIAFTFLAATRLEPRCSHSRGRQIQGLEQFTIACEFVASISQLWPTLYNTI